MTVDMTHGPNRLFRGRAVAPGASRSNGKPGCRAAIAPLPGGNGAVAGMGAGFYIGCSFWYGVMRSIRGVRFGVVRFGGVRRSKVGWLIFRCRQSFEVGC